MFKTILQIASTLFWPFHLSWFVSNPIKTPPSPNISKMYWVPPQPESHHSNPNDRSYRASKANVFKVRSNKKQSKSIGIVIIPWLWTWKEMTPGFSLWNPTDSAQNLLNIKNLFLGQDVLYMWKMICISGNVQYLYLENVLNVWKMFGISRKCSVYLEWLVMRSLHLFPVHVYTDAVWLLST